MGWDDAFAFGSLMNTRGLLELIALNIGCDLGVLSPGIIAMLVLMALITTFLTGPLLDLNQSWQASDSQADSKGSKQSSKRLTKASPSTTR
jgi:Kef-type K+ transport system membrane component KefB